jgi:hypothetical protein
VSSVQTWASLQASAVAQGTHVGSGVSCEHMPSLQASLVQPLPSLH